MENVMSRDINTLDPKFRKTALELLEACEERGIKMVGYSYLRDPYEQARLWRQSRSTMTVKRKVAELRKSNCHFLADCIEKVGPQMGQLGRHVTGAIPGLSWHNHGLAMDAYWKRPDNTASWSITESVEMTYGLYKGQKLNGYKAYGEMAEGLGLYSGGVHWGHDWPHVHQSQKSSPSAEYPLWKIDGIMKERFSVKV
jgi:peptidoglycan LD-endopeptidase CwlK